MEEPALTIEVAPEGGDDAPKGGDAGLPEAERTQTIQARRMKGRDDYSINLDTATLNLYNAFYTKETYEAGDAEEDVQDEAGVAPNEPPERQGEGGEPRKEDDNDFADWYQELEVLMDELDQLTTEEELSAEEEAMAEQLLTYVDEAMQWHEDLDAEERMRVFDDITRRYVLARGPLDKFNQCSRCHASFVSTNPTCPGGETPPPEDDVQL